VTVSSNRATRYSPLDPDAVLWSGTPADPDSALLIMMHGWSYDERHLFALRSRLPHDLTIASLRAPIPEAGGYAWFPEFRDSDRRSVASGRCS
jgi:phospholipase/carboxylesterase